MFIVVEERKEKTLNNILAAKKKIRYEIQELNDRLKYKKDSIQKLRTQISKMEGSEKVYTESVT